MINLRDNKLKFFPAAEIFKGFHTTLQNFDISSDTNVAIGVQDLKRLRNIRSLSMSRLSRATLSPEDFLDFGLDLEDLKVTFGGLTTIKSHAFQHVKGIRRLDLSENQINQIDNEAFQEIGHSLTSIRMSHSLASTITAFPVKPFSWLTSLKHVDLSNNRLKSVGDTSFHFMKSLRTLDLSDNQIEGVAKGTFQVKLLICRCGRLHSLIKLNISKQGDTHRELEMISFSYNSINQIAQHTFVDLNVSCVAKTIGRKMNRKNR